MLDVDALSVYLWCTVALDVVFH